jgi:hypothetical protein
MASRPLNDKGEDDTARWDALERIAASFGLVELFDDPSLCLNAVGTNSTNTSTAEDEEDDVYLWRADDESDPQGEPSKAEHPSITRTRNAHPYLVTRSVHPWNPVTTIDTTSSGHMSTLLMRLGISTAKTSICSIGDCERPQSVFRRSGVEADEDYPAVRPIVEINSTVEISVQQELQDERTLGNETCDPS